MVLRCLVLIIVVITTVNRYLLDSSDPSASLKAAKPNYDLLPLLTDFFVSVYLCHS